MAAVVVMVREVIAAVGTEMTTLESSLDQSTGRLEAIGEATDVRQIRTRLAAEVAMLKQLTLSRQKAWHNTARGLAERIALLESQLVATQAETLTDPLTGIGNRWHFERVGNEWIRDRRSRLALALIDVDDLKQVNDRYGHAAGDGVLVRLARADGALALAKRQGKNRIVIRHR